MDSQPIRFSISLPAWYDRKLRLWARLKGASRAALAANIVQARIEANWDDIDKDLREIAAQNNLTIDELTERWLNDGSENTGD